MALSDLQIKKIAPKAKRYEVHDGGGLYLRIMPTGAKSWVLRYMIDGRPRRLTIGRYPAVSLSEARKQAANEQLHIIKGIDPGVKKQHEKATSKAAPTVADLVEEFWERELSFKASGKERLRLLNKDVVPAWGQRKVAEITRRDAVVLVDQVRERGQVIANRTQSVMVRLFNFAAERGVIAHSPLSGLRKTAEKSRQRALSAQDVRLFWTATDPESPVDLFRQTKLALRLILLTGQRPGEVAGMTWQEIDGNTWSIPAERRKGGIAQSVPLCSLALETIEQARLISGDTPYVFTSSVKTGAAITRHSLSKGVSRHLVEIGIEEAFSPHDLRRTCRTGLAEIGVDDVVAERVLGHKMAGILGTYNVHAYDREKRAALEKWERHIKRIVGIDEEETRKVITLRRTA